MVRISFFHVCFALNCGTKNTKQQLELHKVALSLLVSNLQKIGKFPLECRGRWDICLNPIAEFRLAVSHCFWWL